MQTSTVVPAMSESYREAVKAFRKMYLEAAIIQHNGNLCKTADAIGIHRNTLRRICYEVGLDTLELWNRMHTVENERRPIASVKRGGRIADRGIA